MIRCFKCKSNDVSFLELIRGGGLCSNCSKNEKWKREGRFAFSDSALFHIDIPGYNPVLESSIKAIINEKKGKKAKYVDATTLEGKQCEIEEYYFKLHIKDGSFVNVFPIECNNFILYGKSVLVDDNNIIIPDEKMVSIPLCDIFRIDYCKTYESFSASYEIVRGYKGLQYNDGIPYGDDSHKYEIGKLYSLDELNPYKCEYSESYYHFCLSIEDVLIYRDYINNSHRDNDLNVYYALFEVEASGHVLLRSATNGVSSKMRILREIPKKEIVEYFNLNPHLLKSRKISSDMWKDYCKYTID